MSEPELMPKVPVTFMSFDEDLDRGFVMSENGQRAIINASRLRIAGFAYRRAWEEDHVISRTLPVGSTLIVDIEKTSLSHGRVTHVYHQDKDIDKKPQPLQIDDKATGVIIHWHKDRGFGFLSVIDVFNNEDEVQLGIGKYENVFVHILEVKQELRPFLEVPKTLFIFRMIPNRNGNLQAKIIGIQE